MNLIEFGDCREIMRRWAMLGFKVQTCVTSPPYYGLRDYGHPGQLGLEKSPDEYVKSMVEVFRCVRDVLADDGTLWLNLGDSYAGYHGNKNSEIPTSSTNGWTNGYNENKRAGGKPQDIGLKPKDLIGIPWRVAFALQADGWYLRQDIIWHKPNPMPESVTDRCTKAHEYIFLLSKSPKYFYDAIGSHEETTGNSHARGDGLNAKARSIIAGDHKNRPKQNDSFSAAVNGIVATRNMRSVWPLASFPLKESHFAAYPPELVRRCLSAGISEKGCCSSCGKPWVRVTEKVREATRPGTNAKQHFCSNWQSGKGSHNTLQHNGLQGDHPKTWKSDNFDSVGQRSELSPNRDPMRHVTATRTVGWKADCECEESQAVPCRVLDPFHGAGTTWKVCERLGASYIGIDLNEEYLQLSVDRAPVHFPHERRKPKPRRVRSVVTPMLDGMEF